MTNTHYTFDELVRVMDLAACTISEAAHLNDEDASWAAMNFLVNTVRHTLTHHSADVTSIDLNEVANDPAYYLVPDLDTILGDL